MKELELSIGTLTISHQFMVVGMRNTCILGADFLKSGRMVVDIANSKLTWPSGEVALVIETTAPTVNKLSVLLDNYSDIFVSGPNDPLGRTTVAEHSIDTGDSRPVKQRPYRIPVHLNTVVNKQVNDMIERGVIRSSNSPWSSPIVLAPKKDGDYRFCVDFRRVNSVTKKDAHPMPRIDEILDQLGGARYFSTLDLASGYWQVPLREEDMEKTAFSVGANHYEFTALPFGLTNAPATFQRMMGNILMGIKGCLVFMDDIIIFSDTWEEHQRILDEVFRRIRAAGLKIKRDKCQFAQESVKFLGHIVSARGTEPDSSKVEAVREFATPTSLTDVRAFVGMASYYRRFIKNFADIAAPLHDLTKGGQPEFCWTPVADKAFNDLKSRLCSAPILSLPDFSVPFTIYTDASDFGLGAVLSQRRGENEYVIAYASRTLTSAEKNYSTTEKECLAIVWTVNYWRPYLLGNTFDIVTDHQSLTWLQGLKEPKGRLARWILALQEYDFEIKHRPGRQHSNADTLSRFPRVTPPQIPDQSVDEDLMVGVNGTEVCTSWSKTEILKAQQDDPSISMIMQKLSCSDDLPEEGNDNDNSKENGERRRYRQLWSQLEMVDGVLHRCVDKGTPSKRLVLVVPRKMRCDLLKLSHDDPCSGHMGINRCLERLQRRYYWPGMAAEVQLWIAECEKCNRRKTPVPSQKAPMQSIEIGQPMELWAMDVLGPLPMTARGNQYILVMSDHFTKWVEAVPMPNQRAETVAKAFVNEVVTRHGVPSKLLTDQGRNFEADLMKQVFSLLGVRKLRTSPYHPQTDGQVERMNRTLKGILTAYVNKDHNDWDDHLPLALFAYRNSVHSSSGVSPFQAIYGREATTPLVLMNTETEVKEQFISNYCDELEKTLKDVHRSIKTNIDVAQSKQKKGYDEHNDVDRSTALKEGDRVWLNNKAVPKGLSRKFHSPWTGPYVVIKRLGKVNYHIKPGSGNGKTKVVHRNRLKLDIRQPRIEETLSVDQPEKHNSRVELLPGEPVIHHGERLADAQLLPAEELIQLRRSNRNRRQPDRYQDYNLDELEIEDALN
ncbi:Transposon Ty3-G Gag-Pol poly [Paramuricea clavata]|uniref:RNA-directed DNA polymerase n=1 Tax=Paramuricea clavata TaxID=317549 RepID=A0A7D9HS82_PARCT|nr:Transposon Ty3-G Gag-Pol poly [Paramuricea clavata]